MFALSALYDKDNDMYPIYHTGILMFVLISTIPLNLGLSNLPSGVFLMLLATGFLSLFMVVRNEKVGFGLLTHLKIQRKQISQTSTTVMSSGIDKRRLQDSLETSQESVSDPFSLLQNAVERIIVDHDEQFDLATRVRLEVMNRRLHEMSKQVCKT